MITRQHDFFLCPAMTRHTHDQEQDIIISGALAYYLFVTILAARSSIIPGMAVHMAALLC